MLSSTAPKVSAWVPFEDSGMTATKSVPEINVSSYSSDDFKSLLSGPPINIGTTYQPSFQLRADPNDFQASKLSKEFAGLELKKEIMSDDDIYDNLKSLPELSESIKYEPYNPNIIDTKTIGLGKNNLTYYDLRTPILPLDLKPSNKNYLVKIDEDFKLVTDCQHLNQEQLKKVIGTYYVSNELEIYPVGNNLNLLSTYVCNPNSFLKTNEIDPKVFIEYFNKFDEIINYLGIFGSSWKFTSALQNMGKSPDVFTNKIPNFPQNYQSTRNTGDNLTSLTKIPMGPEMFETDGSYVNNTGNINDISGYSSEFFGQVDGGDNGDYEHKETFMYLENFAESILDYHRDYNIYFNNQFNNVIVVDSKSDFMSSNNKLKKIFPEIIFVAKERLSKEVHEQVHKLTEDIFVNVEDVKTKLNKILNDKVIDSKLSIDEIKFLIKKYFTIDTNPEHCIKFTNIWEIISSELKVSESFINYTKRQLPVILQDLGLNKKRLSDGIYWYGLVRKPLDGPKSKEEFVNKTIEDKPIPCEEFQSIFDKYLMDRNAELKSVTSAYPVPPMSFTLLTNLVNQELKPEPLISPPKPIEMSSIIEFVKQSEITPDCNTKEEHEQPIQSVDPQQPQPVQPTQAKKTKATKPKPVKQPKTPKQTVQPKATEEPVATQPTQPVVSEELTKLVVKSKGGKTAKSTKKN